MGERFLILGGAGLVGLQVCRRIARKLNPECILVASLQQEEAESAVASLRNEYGDNTKLEALWGNLFVPTDLCSLSRGAILEDPHHRKKLLNALYGPFEESYTTNHLKTLIETHKPDVVVDCVNTATGLSYQNVFEGAKRVMHWMSEDDFDSDGVQDLQSFLLSQSVPQIIRHIRILHRATTEHRVRAYLKVGTTGTGGMGLNIPYTHSEDKPSKVLLAKSEAAFGHTGLLFLLARTPNAPVIKEVKPAAMIGYRAVKTIIAKDKNGNQKIFVPRNIPMKGDLTLRESTEEFEEAGDLMVTIVDTGENGVFTRGEFAAITSMGQMEYITPEEIARVIVQEIRGVNSGRDIISSLDSSVLNPSYKAGLVRSAALSDLSFAEGETALPSVALGKLGPPELSKLLFEAQLLKERFKTIQGVLYENGEPRTPDDMAATLAEHLMSSSVKTVAPSIGIPILLPGGEELLRGPHINVPEATGHSTQVSLDDPALVDSWARKGWVDLRPTNMQCWRDRVQKMASSRIDLREMGSAASSIRSYLPTKFEIGEVVAWIFNNEMGGHRIK